MERRSGTRFAPSEIARMEKLAADRKEQVLDENFCRKLAGEFNRSAGRVGSRALQATQVQGWFLDKFPVPTPKPICMITATEEMALDSQADVLVSETKAPASEDKDLGVSETKAPASEDKDLGVDTSVSNNVDEVSLDSHKVPRDKVPEIDNLRFEARSTKDNAW